MWGASRAKTSIPAKLARARLVQARPSNEPKSSILGGAYQDSTRSARLPAQFEMSNELLKWIMHWGSRSGSLVQNYPILAELRGKRRKKKNEEKKNCPHWVTSSSMSILSELALSAGGSFLDFLAEIKLHWPRHQFMSLALYTGLS